MDISKIDISHVTPEVGIHIGKSDAPVKIIEFINLACPYCKTWHELSLDVLDRYVEAGKVERIIKHFDKEKEILQPGNVAHHHLPYDDPATAKAAIDFLFEHQAEWHGESLMGVGEYVKDRLHLSEELNEKAAQNIIAEANQANIFFVPTVIIDEHIFDEHITAAELTKLIEEALAK